MDYIWPISIASFLLALTGTCIWLIVRKKNETPLKETLKDIVAQNCLDDYHTRDLTLEEIGQRYERYIGYLYETKGFQVEYHGALNGFKDLGRDLIVNNKQETLIIQTKRWAKRKYIPIKHIYQLYGSMMHYKLSQKESKKSVSAIFITSAKYSDISKEAADLLGMELRQESLDKSYPMIKCHICDRGSKQYYIPTDPSYDMINVNPTRGDFFAKNVKEAIGKGFRRSDVKKDVA